MSETAPLPSVSPTRIVVVGGGRTGAAILDLLRPDPHYDPLVCDVDYDRLRQLQGAGFEGVQISGADCAAMTNLLRTASAVICAAPPSVALPVAQAACDAGCHYVDMCEDAHVLARITAALDGATGGACGFATGCGLAPGLVTALVNDVVTSGPPEADITAYVGVLPAAKTNRLGYGNLWDLDGMMAEYFNPCQMLVAGRIVSHPPLGELEHLTIGGTEFEAFSTAGSLDDLVHHHAGKLRGLSFKTLRYPGHLDYVRFLLDDLRLSERQYLFRNLLLNGLPRTEQDHVIIHIVDRAPPEPRHKTLFYQATTLGTGYRSAVASLSARHVCAVADLLVRGLVPSRGLLHHGDLSLTVLAQSAYGRALQAVA